MTQEKNEEINYHRKILKKWGEGIKSNYFFSRPSSNRFFLKKIFNFSNFFAFFFFRADLKKVIIGHFIYIFVNIASMEDHAFNLVRATQKIIIWLDREKIFDLKLF